VPQVRIVDVPAELISLETVHLCHIPAGLSHGSRFETGCTDRQWLACTDAAENKPRFAALAVLYGWVHANDNQLIYRQGNPPLVFSVDHGHFFHGGPGWSPGTLDHSPAPELNREIVAACQLDEKTISEALHALAQISEEQIANAVAAPPDDWTITLAERVAVAGYLHRRRLALIQTGNQP